MQTTIFDQLCHQLHVEPDHKGEVWIDCPNCGKGRRHFSFNERAGHCFACDYSATLATIAKQLNITQDAPAAPRRPLDPPKPKHWQHNPGRYLDGFCGALDRVEKWQRYKPLSLDSINRFRLGVGILPSSRCPHRRLILPVRSGGRLVAFHGRACNALDTDAKWLTAGGSDKKVLFGADLLRPGITVVVCENFVDAILAMQVEPQIVTVAGGGASWQTAWTQQIAASRPRHVLVWLDNDLVGCPNAETRHELLRAWRIAHPDAVRAPEPKGPQIANELLASGVKASVYQWPSDSPPKADIGWQLMGGVTR
jgi:hypothetical protein